MTTDSWRDRAHVSNPCLSQIERGLHEPSVKELRAIADALNVSAETLLAQGARRQDAGSEDRSTRATEKAIRADRADRALSAEQKQTLLAVYRNFVRGAYRNFVRGAD